MKKRDGRSRKTPKGKGVPVDKKNSVEIRRLRPCEIRKRVEDVLIHIILGSLVTAFPDGTVRDTARFLMKASATHGSLTSSRRYSKRGYSRRQMARVVEALEQGRLQRLITHTLRKQAMPFIPEEKCTVAIDLHLVPYYGRKNRTEQLVTTKARDGTNHFHGYSTIYCVKKNRRLTFGMRAVRVNRMLPLLKKHLADASACNVRIGMMLLDREFYCVDVITFLKNERIPFIMPVKTGRRMAGGWCHGKRSFTTAHTLHSGDKSVDVTVHVAKRMEKERVKSYFFAVYRVNTSPKQTMWIYRHRFGIESSYRITEIARPRTTSHSTSIRLLNMFVAVLIENEWVVVKLLYASERHRGGPAVDEELIRFTHLLKMVERAVNRICGEKEVLENKKPPPTEMLKHLEAFA